MPKDTTIPKVGKTSWSFGTGRFVLALIITGAAFGLIMAMILIQQYTIGNALEEIERGTPMNETEAKIFRENYGEVFQSNLSLFNILLPVFGAWVGAVVAFYFGSENLQKAQETIQNLSKKPEEILAGITVAQLLNDYPTARNVISSKMNERMDKIIEKLDSKEIKGGPLLIVDDKEKPLGLLFRTHLFEAMKSKPPNPPNLTSADLESGTTRTLEPVINGIKDFVTDENWTVNGVKNFAELKLTNNLFVAHSLMHAISDHPAVRGIVIENKKAIAIIDHEMIASKVRGTSFQ